MRLWVEIYSHSHERPGTGSASSWGCELKWISGIYRMDWSERQPLREAVSWNTIPFQAFSQSPWSASSWGCELKYPEPFNFAWSTRSASSWGCELKCNREICMRISRFVSLFVRLWIEIKWQDETVETVLRQPLRETVRWNFCKKCNRIYFFASFFIRLWVGRKQR